MWFLVYHVLKCSAGVYYYYYYYYLLDTQYIIQARSLFRCSLIDVSGSGYVQSSLWNGAYKITRVVDQGIPIKVRWHHISLLLF